MKKRHRIQGAFFGKRVKGWGVFTTNGASFYVAGTFGRQKLARQAPHLVALLKKNKPQTDDELNALLKGRYIYGEAKEKKNFDGETLLFVD